MLVLTRKVGERIHIGDGIVVTVVRLQSDKVRIGIEAPSQVAVHREEIYRRVQAEVARQAPAEAATDVPTSTEPPRRPISALSARRGAR